MPKSQTGTRAVLAALPCAFAPPRLGTLLLAGLAAKVPVGALVLLCGRLLAVNLLLCGRCGGGVAFDHLEHRRLGRLDHA